MKKHSIRIVGGQYRRTQITVPDVPGLRPTPDRVRETLFNWLHHFWNGEFAHRRVLDLFAGTGALGFEAASRGVAMVQMVESDPRAVAALRAVRERLNATAVRIHAGDAQRLLAHSRMDPFDLILLDPPFGEGRLERVLPFAARLLRPDGLIYFESDGPLTPLPDLDILRQERAGQVHFGLARFDAARKTDNNSATHS
ncbi:MAG: 16S rRNA (guanine(966)-N(2))-methyltransferase RsmD [Castellaniella sp.]